MHFDLSCFRRKKKLNHDYMCAFEFLKRFFVLIFSFTPYGIRKIKSKKGWIENVDLNQ